MDPFMLPNPDQMVDETSGCELLSYMYAFKGYHKIFMEIEDQEKPPSSHQKGFFATLSCHSNCETRARHIRGWSINISRNY